MSDIPAGGGLGKKSDDVAEQTPADAGPPSDADAPHALAEWKRARAAEHRYGEQFRSLAEAAVAVNSASTLEEALQVVTEQARRVIGAHQAVTSMSADLNWAQAINAVSLSEKYAEWRSYDRMPDGSGIYQVVAQMDRPMRLTQSELEAHPAWRAFGKHAAEHPPMRGWLAAPLVSRDGQNLGLVQLSDRYEGEFTEQDEAILVHLSQMAAVAIENVRLYEDAQAARSEAEAANRAKSEFLSTMSHEIRTPINAIIGYVDLLEMGIAGPVTEQQKEQLERVRASGHHLTELVDDILDLAKVEAGRLNVEHERALAATAIAGALALVHPQAVRKRIAVRYPSDDSITFYVGDEDRVRQILVNLLSNAVKFTEPGGEIVITCGTTRGVDSNVIAFEESPPTYIRVQDTGVGIAPKQVEKVFRPFTQVQGGHTRRHGGTGLGLTISRQLARLMGGDLTLESERGEGSTFTLWLPSEAVQPPPLEQAVLDEAREAPPHGLAAVGEALHGETDSVRKQFVARLRADAHIPTAADAEKGDLEDHASTLLADIAQSLIILERSRATPERLLRDGSEIQRVICELHGAQRAQLGWTEEALRREWGILRDEIETAVQRGAPADSDIPGALRLLGRFLEQAERISDQSLRRARAAGMPEA